MLAEEAEDWKKNGWKLKLAVVCGLLFAFVGWPLTAVYVLAPLTQHQPELSLDMGASNVQHEDHRR